MKKTPLVQEVPGPTQTLQIIPEEMNVEKVILAEEIKDHTFLPLFANIYFTPLITHPE